jgi:hypothetical protein
VAVDAGDRRAAGALERCVWLIPIVTALGGAIAFYGMLQAHRNDAIWPVSARVVMAVYGAVAVAVGAAATSGVLRLLATCAGLTLGGWLGGASGAVGRMSAVVAEAIRAMKRDPRRWAIVAGLSLWLYVFASFAMFGLAYPGRYSGETPMLDFIGPRVPAVAMAGDVALRYNTRIPQNELFRLCLFNLLAVWLMTWPGGSGSGSRKREWLTMAARCSALLLAGAMIGLGLWGSAQRGLPFRHPRVVAAIIAPADALATVLVYLHLASVAARLAGKPSLAWALRWRGCVGVLIGLVPLVYAFYFPAPRTDHPGTGALVIAIVQGAAAVGVTFLCAGALARLAWGLAVSEVRQVDSAAIDPGTNALRERVRPELTVHLPETLLPQHT